MESTDLSGSLRDGDFEETDVWEVLKERKDANYSKVVIEAPDLSVERNLNLTSAAAVMIPIRTSSNNNYRDKGNDAVLKQLQSAPMKIPDWSKISKKKSKKKVLEDDSDDGDSYDCKVPPHEYIAQRLAKSQVSSFSVFEGVGRTLKGRDLSKVRDAVLTKTGFLE